LHRIKTKTIKESNEHFLKNNMTKTSAGTVKAIALSTRKFGCAAFIF